MSSPNQRPPVAAGSAAPPPPTPPPPPATRPATAPPSTSEAATLISNNKKNQQNRHDDKEPEAENYKVHQIEDLNHFDRMIDEAGNRIVFIEFFAEWCGPCKLIGRELDNLALQYGSKILIIKIDVDDFEELAIKHDVTMMPTFIVMQNKKKLEQFSGSNTEKIVNAVAKFCGDPENADMEDAQPLMSEPVKAEKK